MPAVIGYLDQLVRPRASITFANSANLDLLIDTGFNGGLFLGDQTALLVGVVLKPLGRNVVVASGQGVRVQEGGVDVIRTSAPQRRRTDVFVYSPEPAARRGEPQGLLGMSLIAPDKLIIDCLNSDVRITP